MRNCRSTQLTNYDFKTCSEHFLRVRQLVESNEGLRSRVSRITTSHGDEGIELAPLPTLITGSGSKGVRRGRAQRLRFLARSRTSARGFTADCLVWDEAMVLSDAVVGAALPTLSAVRNPQLWYAGSAGERDSTQLARIRQRGLAGGDPSLAYFEWSIDPCAEYCPQGCTEHDDPAAVESWAKANPGLGIRLSVEHVAREMPSMGGPYSPVFQRERLGVGDWPTDENGWAVISEEDWAGCADPDSPRPRRPWALAVDATPDLSASAIAISGLRPDGKVVVEIPDGCHRGGTSWVIGELQRLIDKLRPCAVIIDPRSPAASLIDEAELARLEITKPGTIEVAQAFGLFCTAVTDRQVTHLGKQAQPGLHAAVAGAADRAIGDGGRAWARRSTSVDISPLVACTMACWGFNKFGRRSYDILRSVG